MMLILAGGAVIVSKPIPVSAAEASAEQSTEEKTDPDDADKQPTDKPANNSEVFIPTEEISEDFAVSFPVDI